MKYLSQCRPGMRADTSVSCRNPALRVAPIASASVAHRSHE